jgi:hypothetical protein
MEKEHNYSFRQKIVEKIYEKINVIHTSIPIKNKECWVRNKVLKDCWGCPQ